MKPNRLTSVLALLLTPWPAGLAAQEVPQDLGPLLQREHNRLDLVAQRYADDRDQLDRFFAVPLATAHLQKLARFDTDWLAALERLGGTGFSAAENGALQKLVAEVRRNLQLLRERAGSYPALRELLPFARAIEVLLDARRKVRPMDAQASAGVIAAVTGRIGELTGDLDAGRLRIPNRKVGTAAAEAARELRRLTRDWFQFYDGYDPLFTWWMAKPYEAFGSALDGYTAKLANPQLAVLEDGPAAPAADVEPAPAAERGYAPDLAALLAYPHNEMLGVWRAFSGEGGGARRGPRGARGQSGRDRGDRGAGNRGTGRRGRTGGRGFRGRGGAPRNEAFYTAWGRALKTLDFPALSRPAQVTYLRMRNDIEVGMRRLRTPAQREIPVVPDDSGITGRPIGRTALELSLAEEMIPYTPEELIAIGDAEYAWCMREMLKAAKELGYGERWRDALEHVKRLHVPPGGQPVLIRELMFEAVDFLREHDMLTVPQVAAETLTLGMMSPARQLVNPFFTGGTRISVSFPTNGMAHDAKLQSMRGNNIPFSRATVHHELIPGHNLQFFFDRRFGGTRAGSRSTPFHLEGWAVYFEMLLYRMGFPRITAERSGGPKDAENRIGFLFWRMHRSARITFSLRFHMGLWSAQQCIDFLVDGVGHERDNATAEVRRSFAGSYGPLYQAGYLLGAVQFRKLNEEVVQAGKMSQREFHDRIIRAGPMPVALVRLLVDGEPLSADMPLAWKFYGAEIPGVPR